jgi:hypothetical protein
MYPGRAKEGAIARDLFLFLPLIVNPISKYELAYGLIIKQAV